MNNKAQLVIGKPYQAHWDHKSDIYTINGVFGSYADCESKKTRRSAWLHVDDLVPVVKNSPKRYLKPQG